MVIYPQFVIKPPSLAATKRACIVGMRELDVERDKRSTSPFRGRFVNPGLKEPTMFKLPAYDPVGIAMLGFGVLAVVALAFVF
jgi:hypothetical protein